MENIKITFEFLPIFGAAWVFLAWWFPGLKQWYEQLSSEYKQLVNIGLLALIAVVASLLSLAGLVKIYPVDQGWYGLVWLPFVDLMAALIANAGVYKATNYALSPK